MDAEAQEQINELRQEIAQLKAALVGVSSAFHQLRIYIMERKEPTLEGQKRFDDYLSQIDRVATPGSIRGFGAP